MGKAILIYLHCQSVVCCRINFCRGVNVLRGGSRRLVFCVLTLRVICCLYTPLRVKTTRYLQNFFKHELKVVLCLIQVSPFITSVFTKLHFMSHVILKMQEEKNAI